MAAVLGIGVAVITSTSGTRSSGRPRLRSTSRCSTPKRCCSSTTTTPSEASSTPSWMSAWVPTTRSTDPSARPARIRRRSAAPIRLTSSSTASGLVPPRRVGSLTSRPASRAPMPRWCCSASTSVGAISAAWCPPSTAASIVPTATTVLPEPTSPCRRRCIGLGRARSIATVSSARRWASVTSNGSRERNDVTSGPSTTWVTPRRDSSISRFRLTRLVCTRNSSSNTSRRRASSLAAMDSGAWMWCSASSRESRSWRRRRSPGTGSAMPRPPARRSASATHPATSHVVSPAFSDWG